MGVSLGVLSVLWEACQGSTTTPWQNPVTKNPEAVVAAIVEAWTDADDIDDLEALVSQCFDASCDVYCDAFYLYGKEKIEAQQRGKMTLGLIYVVTLVRNQLVNKVRQQVSS